MDGTTEFCVFRTGTVEVACNTRISVPVHILNASHSFSLCRLLTYFYLYHDATAPSWPRPPHCRGFTITLRHTTLGRTLDERSVGRRDLYLTTHNTQEGQTFLPPEGFDPTIPASERPQAHTLDRAASEIGRILT